MYKGAIINLVNCSNVTITGGVLDGQKSLYPTAAINGFSILGCDHITLRRTLVQNCPASSPEGGTLGDGYYIGDNSTNILLDEIGSDGNVRQGVTITSGQHIRIQNHRITNTTGSAPGAAIDLEKNLAADILDDIAISGGYYENNNFGVVVSDKEPPNEVTNVTVEGGVFRKHRNTTIILRGRGCTAKNNDIDYEHGYAISLFYPASQSTADANHIKGHPGADRAINVEGLDGNQVINNEITDALVNGIFADTYYATLTALPVTGNVLINCASGGSAIRFRLFDVGNDGLRHGFAGITCTGNTITDNQAVPANTGILTPSNATAEERATYVTAPNTIDGPLVPVA